MVKCEPSCSDLRQRNAPGGEQHYRRRVNGAIADSGKDRRRIGAQSPLTTSVCTIAQPWTQ